MSFAYSRLKSPCPDKRSPFSVLRFVLFGERCLEIKRNVCGLMGALHSAIEQGKQRRKAKKRLVERKIAIAREYSRTLDDELERAERHLNVLLDTSDVTSCSSATLSGCTTVTLCASLQSLVSEMDSGVSIEEVNTPDELSDETVSLIMESRCDKLDDNLRLLEEKEDEIINSVDRDSSKLDGLHLKMESFQFRHFVAVNPVESWSVCSMPPR